MGNSFPVAATPSNSVQLLTEISAPFTPVKQYLAISRPLTGAATVNNTLPLPHGGVLACVLRVLVQVSGTPVPPNQIL